MAVERKGTVSLFHPLELVNNSQGDQHAIRLGLQCALTVEERGWVRRMCREEHYLKQEVHGRARPVAYLVLREEGVVLANGTFVAHQRNRVGLLVFSRMQSSRCNGWYGSSQDVACGKAKHTQWEILVLSRCWLDPRIQRNGCWHIPKVASLVIKRSLQTIGYEYLLLRPPAFPERPFEIKEVISYCQSDRYLCMVYWFARFKLVRENATGLRTYMHTLPPLNFRQRQIILELSRLSKAARQKRLASFSPTLQEVLLLTSRSQRCAA